MHLSSLVSLLLVFPAVFAHSSNSPRSMCKRQATGFQHQNGVDAQKQNAEFKQLSATSACTSGQDACINNQFAQCDNGKFVLTPCSAGTICAALPLVQKAGTSIACTTEQDRDSRISIALGTAQRKKRQSSSLQAQNGKQAQQENQQFQSLNAQSSCQTNQAACINNQFAKCDNGKFVIMPCGGGLICASLPLVNSKGTSVTCTTAADRDQRIKTAMSS